VPVLLDTDHLSVRREQPACDRLLARHGRNLGLKSRDPSDYQVSILEVAGTSLTTEDVLAMEGRWQAKLQSQEMGLNRNWAGQS